MDVLRIKFRYGPRTCTSGNLAEVPRRSTLVTALEKRES